MEQSSRCDHSLTRMESALAFTDPLAFFQYNLSSCPVNCTVNLSPHARRDLHR